MSRSSTQRGCLRIYEFDVLGPSLRSASDILSDVFSAGGNFVVIPVARLDRRFFQLSTGMAGEIMQKFVNYGVRLAVIGDISSLTAASKPLRDLVYEMNQGTVIWFVLTREQLETRLALEMAEAE
jgi:Domain of unknown function (DUF4180)